MPPTERRAAPRPDGVGLHLFGIPPDKEQFIQTLTEYGCPEFVAKNIYQDLLVHGERKVTMTARVPLDLLIPHLALLNVYVKRIPPKLTDPKG